MNGNRTWGMRWRPTYWLLLGVLAVANVWAWDSLATSVKAGYTPLATFGQYSYSSSSCSTIVDPVTIVFTFGDGSWDDPHDHYKISDHGDWDGSANGGQYFYDDTSGCSGTDDHAGTSGGWPTPNDGWHARWEVAWTTLTSHSYAGTPHWDDWDWTENTHCVREDGFTDGRDETKGNFESSAHDHSVVANYWNNDEPIKKCGDEYAANWDGKVYYVDLR